MASHYTRRDIMVGGAGALALAAGSEPTRAQVQQPNIVFIMADDLG